MSRSASFRAIAALAALLAASAAIAQAELDVDGSAPSELEPGSEVETRHDVLPEDVVGFFVLSFNRWGELRAAGEREQLISHLRANPQIERLLVISYGWANDGESSYGTYLELVRDLLATRHEAAKRIPTSVIAIGWDSTQTGFRKLANDLIPFPVLADWLAFLPDNLLFPISFWSKAAMADRIGYGGLRSELNTIFASAYPQRGDVRHPEIVLVGHSFGTRIVSGLMQNDLALARVRAEPFQSAEHVRAALLIQPALVLPNLHRHADYPVVVTQSRHDHANGFLFPTANLLVNAYSFTSFEAIFRQRVFRVVTEQAERGTQMAADAMAKALPDFMDGRKKGEDAQPGALEGLQLPLPPLADRPFDLLQRGLAEGASVPIALLYSAVTTPVNYVATQVRGLVRGPHHHVMDTLAQLPVLEIATDVASDAFDVSPRWGERHKGFFDFGLLNESAGRLTIPPYEAPSDFPVVSLDELRTGAARADGACGLPACKGLVFVDVSTAVDTGVFGLSLERRWVDYTIGWLDPIGAHADYRKPEIIGLMGRVTHRVDGD